VCPASSSSAKPGTDNSGRLSKQDDAIIEAAWCYYHEGLNQSQIATKLGVSRASVVNYLAESRRRNYVRVTLDSELFLHNELAAELRDAYNLTQVLVIPADSDSEHRTYERVVRSASDWLPQLLNNGDVLGVAWGETVSRLSEIAPAHCINLHVPLFLSNAELCQQLVREPSVAEQLKAVADCSKVIFAAGTCLDDSHIVRTGLLSSSEMARYRKKGAVGVICGRLINADGEPMEMAIEERMIGVSLEQMRTKKMGFLVTAEQARIAATRAAIVGGYVTHLAVCSETARQLLEG